MDSIGIAGFSLLKIYDRSGKMSIPESFRFHALEIQVRQTIREFGMLAPGDHILVAVSGGADSSALVHSLLKLVSEFRLSLTIAHLNHRIRGVEGDADAEFVRQMSLNLGLPFVTEVIEVKQQALASKQNLEELARNLRYDFLRRTATQVGATRIAVGHNLNDQAETVLFRFFRGSGIEGLSAIHPVVDELIIRPLIGCSRDLIQDYLRQRNIRYCEDSTNKDLRYARNRIRKLLPYIQARFNPQLLHTLSREAELARETWAFMESQASAAYRTLRSETDEGISINIPMILEFPPALQKHILRHALKECLGSLRGVGFVHIRNLLSLCISARSGDKIPLPHGGKAYRQFDSLILWNHSPKPTTEYTYVLDVPGQCYVAEAGVLFRCVIDKTPSHSMMRQSVSHQAFLNADALPKQLRIRPRIPGDRYGGSGHRKVKKMLIDGKIPLLQRASLPMIVAGNDVLWIPGFRPAPNYAVKPDSENCLLIEMIKL
jgi:tRNA(Ile)-lysidine synthase